MMSDCMISRNDRSKLYIRAARVTSVELLNIHSTLDHEPLLGRGSMPSVLHNILYTSTDRMGPARKLALKSGERK